MMTKRKIWIITALFLAVLTGFRLLWLQYNSVTDYPVASDGVLDLRHWDPLTDHSLPLRGEWEFSPGTFQFQSGAPPADIHSSGRWIQVPGSWKFDGDQPHGGSKYGFGTYRLRILVDPGKGRSYGIHIPTIRSSSEVYVNGQLLGRSGQPAGNKDRYTPLDIPYTVYFTLEDKSEIELVIQASNFEDILNGGMVRPLKFGLESTLRKDLSFAEDMAWVACVAYAIHVLYGFVLYLVGGRDRRLIYYSLMILCVIFATLWDGERLLFTWVPFTFEWGSKSIYLVMLTGGYFLHRLIKDKLPPMLQGRASKAYEVLCGIAFLTVVLLPLPAVLTLLGLLFVLTFIPCLLTSVVMYRSASRIDADNIYLLLAAIAAFNSMIWLIVINIVQIDMISYPFDLTIGMICFSAFWFKRYFRMSEEAHSLAETLQQADKQKDDFLSTVAHELRNPLHGMINISQAVSERERNQLGISSAQDLQLLVKVGRRMSYMLNDLLDMARLKENRISLNLAGVSVHGAASSVIDTLRFMTEGKPIRLINRVPVGFPLVHADENRLNQVLFNLLHNAVKYSHAGEVSVQAGIQDGWASISVADTGIGMAPETLNRIFEPYEQVSSDLASLKGGFGLGLSICKKLVEMHGGALEVYSKPNEGSVFTFTLKLIAAGAVGELASPLIAAADTGFEEAPGTPIMPNAAPIYHSSPDRVRLLAVDDDPVNLNVLRTIFTDVSYEVFTAINGKEALRLLESGSWDLIIADVTMPVMSGYELTARIRERYSIAELPVLLLTASSQDKDIEAGFRSGANDYVTKPVNATELRSRVRSLTNLKHSVNERLRMEAALLQAQIKPHFLINTFNAVSALSRIDTDKMDDLIEELSNYFRLGIDFQNSDQAVPLDREIKLIRSYLYIQKKRFEDRLQVVWEVDDGVSISIPPLTIQPLVENAVTHGVLKRNAGGEVRIRIADLGRSVEICVSDNGVGIDEEALKHILDRQPDGRTGIGLLNTHRRIKQFSGSGLTIDSRLGSGTSVSFTIAKAEVLS
ncbi:hybrid sensor histidine kinase/response regulator [Paenibacillus spongiae]|uniref:histidine kinase n=1 Tax=Paenibacillus spongiae TaxID=2909671 RepID=A0ABY5S8K6_9BACL|nr:ATP-binding protein [Paenibacillus spongiae]UVI30247.1 ATP-binding protein [Paenibacillus spongiae]